jgi:predicted dehydrogenase
MSNLRCAVIGVGYLGRFHAQKYHTMDGVDLVGVFDAHLPQAKLIAEELQVPVFESLNQLIGAVDAVSIAATTSAHYDVAKFCLSHGIHVLIEKPITQTCEQAQELVEIAQAKQLVVQVGHLERFNPSYQAFHKLAKEVRLIEAQRLATFKKRGSDVDVILDLMIHDLDLVLSLVNSDVVHIHAQGLSVMTNAIDLANVSLSFANGCVAHLTASRVYSGLERLMRVYQEDGYYALNFQQQKLTRFIPNPKAENGIFLQTEEIECQTQDALNAQIKEFVNAVKTGSAVQVDGQAGLAALKLAIQIQSIIEKERSFG